MKWQAVCERVFPEAVAEAMDVSRIPSEYVLRAITAAKDKGDDRSPEELQNDDDILIGATAEWAETWSANTRGSCGFFPGMIYRDNRLYAPNGLDDDDPVKVEARSEETDRNLLNSVGVSARASALALYALSTEISKRRGPQWVTDVINTLNKEMAKMRSEAAARVEDGLGPDGEPPLPDEAKAMLGNVPFQVRSDDIPIRVIGGLEGTTDE